MVSNNAINTAIQPGFFSYLTNTTGGITGAGAVYRLGSGGNTFTIPFQNGNDFSNDCVFTPSKAGLYFFNMIVVYLSITDIMDDLDLVFNHSVAGIIDGYNQNPGVTRNSSGGLVANVSLIYPMQANETMQFSTAIQNGGGNSVSIRGFNSINAPSTTISGFLVYYL